MSQITRHSDTCQVRMDKSSKSIDAVVQSFNEHARLDVIINKSVKLSMVWNGRLYEGRAAGMDFVSDGPTVVKTQTGIRG